MTSQSTFRSAEDSRRRIVDAAARIVRDRGPLSVTTEEIAREARCAKGLVHYHFRGKSAVWTAVIVHLANHRVTRWERALRTSNPDDAIQRTWRAIIEDRETGEVQLMGVLAGTSDETDATIRRVMNEFAEFIGLEVASLLSRVGLTPTVPERQLGWTIAMAANGAAMHLGAGVVPQELEEGYAATWIGVLSLSQ